MNFSTYRATCEDADLVYLTMMRAFQVYANENPPSSALVETVHSISAALKMANSQSSAVTEPLQSGA